LLALSLSKGTTINAETAGIAETLPFYDDLIAEAARATLELRSEN
jgi:hypothetical protein